MISGERRCSPEHPVLLPEHCSRVSCVRTEESGLRHQHSAGAGPTLVGVESLLGESSVGLDEGHLEKLLHVGALFVLDERGESLEKTSQTGLTPHALHESILSEVVLEKSREEVGEREADILRDEVTCRAMPVAHSQEVEATETTEVLLHEVGVLIGGGSTHGLLASLRLPKPPRPLKSRSLDEAVGSYLGLALEGLNRAPWVASIAASCGWGQIENVGLLLQSLLLRYSCLDAGLLEGRHSVYI